MLSIKDLKYYCRTCLVKLEHFHDEDLGKSIATSKHPELEQFIGVCLAKATAGDDSICLYVPFLCHSCFEKWLDFVKLYRLAVKTDEKIRKILEKEAFKNETREEHNEHKVDEEHDNAEHKYFVDTEDLVDIREIEKCGTSTAFFVESGSNDHTRIQSNNGGSLQMQENDTELEKRYDDIESGDSGESFLDNSTESDRKKIPSKRKKNTTSKCALKRKYRTRKCNLEHSIEGETTSRTILNESEDGNEDSLKKTRYQCKLCNKYFWEKRRFEGHMKQIHEGIKRPYQCNQCEKAYNLYKTLLQHKRECHSEKAQETFKCDQCDKIFKTAVILKQHITNKHSEQKEAMRSICDQCGFIAAHQYSLARHIINKHTETDQIKCDQCPKVFKTSYSLKYHILGNHNPMNIKPFKCSECQVGFTRKTLLNQHKRTHLKYTERIKCDFEGCEVRFVKRGDKTHHMRLVHLKVKQHICDFCGEAFGAMQTLRHHRFIHTGEKPYKCNVCGQGFRQRTAMKTHRKTHFGKEPDNQDVIRNLPEINLSLVNT